jgi:ribosome-associated protein
MQNAESNTHWLFSINANQESIRMIEITPSINLDENEMHANFIRSSGPGGQHVNKVSTAVQLRWDALHSPSLPEYVKDRLKAVAGRRLTKDGVLVITAQKFRSQDQNRRDAIDRIVSLIAAAALRPLKRHATAPTRASRNRRLQIKKQRSAIKQFRRSAVAEE